MELVPNRQEVLRYLGYHGQNIDAQTESLLSRSTEEIQAALKPRYTYGIFTIEKQNNEVFLPECGLALPGKDIARHLSDCQKAVLLAVTLGIEADNLIRIAQAESMSRAVVLDAIATDLTEKLCDKAEDELTILARRENLFLTGRYSPGYGDLPITVQSRIGEILDTTRKIGLTITEHSLMIPRKSVTAIIGFSDKRPKEVRSCDKCSMKDRCNFKKEGSPCGY